MYSDEQRRSWAALQIGPLYEAVAPGFTAPENPVARPVKQVNFPLPDLLVAPPPTELPNDWSLLREHVSQCQRCTICSSRTQTVFAEGQPGSALMIVGEAPGEEEDRKGEPFVGLAGKLLSNMLAAIGVRRGQDVVIVNALKCRPPANRNPSPDELAACKPYLQQQIELVRPKVLLLTGRFAALAVLGLDESLAHLRATEHYYSLNDGTKVPAIVSYHTAYYLRKPSDKVKGWADLITLKRLLNA
jgi:uracil-DNA glycosylase